MRPVKYIFLVWGLVILAVVIPDYSLFSFDCDAENCRVMMSLSLQDIAIGPAFIFALFLMPRKEMAIYIDKVVGIWRRVGAFYIDLIIITTILGTMVSLPLFFAEFYRNGEFQWFIYRNMSITSGRIMQTGYTIFTLGIWFYYYYKHLLLNRPTLGQRLMGYQIYGNDQPWTKTRGFKRVSWALLSLFLTPITTFLAFFTDNKIFWFDKKTNSLPKYIRYPET